MVDKPWHSEGLRFKCTGCGKCCTGGPGYVFLTEEDIDLLSAGLELKREDFLKRYTRTVGNRISLVEVRPHYDCVFLKEGRLCTVYNHRPVQCRTYPFWPENLSSPEAWALAATQCEGINHPDAPLRILP